ncbi:hypothetical protein [Roseinatronobacter sp.]|uniref:hypothetical protein n=1 Tax=Roseinatronobacter sp. TaxID=1945755 RepID=UPI0025CDD643|nr:hypothetical protein [Rhodobaca sp.]
MRKTACLAAAFCIVAPALHADSLTLFATGEDLATAGFTAPKLTRDGWALEFSRIMVSFDQITAWQSNPPFMADGPEIFGEALVFPGPVIVDLVDADEDDRVKLASMVAAPGHYNALSWALVPAASGEIEGYSLVLEGVARKDGQDVAFTLRSADAMMHACGEYMGDTRKGFVTDDSAGDLEITLHLDHLFGRADKGAEDETNIAALGFDSFAAGGVYEFSLGDLHVGHVGEGHCHVTSM